MSRIPSRAGVVSRLRYLAFGAYVRPRPSAELIRLGTSYGGWVVPKRVLRPGTLCYCFGVGEDISFDLALVDQFGCEVFAFDPTPRSAAYVRSLEPLDSRFHFVPVGVWKEPGELKFYEPKDASHVSHSIVNLQRTDGYFIALVDTVPALMAERTHTRLGILKLDVEGAEHAALEPLLAAATDIDVICVEFDQPSSVLAVLRTTRALRKAGYTLVARERWDCTFAR